MTYQQTFLLLLIFITSLIPQSGQTQKEARIVDSLVATYHQAAGPGIAVSIVKDGNIVYHKETGFANLEYDNPITDSTVFHVASVSKQFAVFAILLLEEEGKLSLDDDIRKHLQELGDLKEKISIRQLANHTSGFRNTFDLANLKGIANEDLMSQEQMVKLLLRQKELNFSPGLKFEYCNAGFVLLAEIVKRVSGQSFAEFSQDRIFTPLKMKHSLFLDDPSRVVKNKAYSYRQSEAGYRKIPLNRTVVGATGLNTTSHDLSLWAMNFDEPIIGNREIFRKMKRQSQLSSGEKISYTLGQEVKMYRGVEVVFHGGGDAGYRAYLLRIPEHQFSVVVMGNAESFNPLDISYGLVDLYLSDSLAPASKPSIPAYRNKDLKRFEGDYQVFAALYIRLIAQEDSLYLQPYGTEQLLKLPVIGENTFSFPYIPHSKIVFNDKGLKWHFSDFAYAGQKVHLSPPKAADLDLPSYLGTYESTEVETAYTFVLREKELIATHPFNTDLSLRPIAKDTFITDSGFLSRVEYVRNKKGQIISCKISGQNARGIWFEKRE